MGVSDKVDAAAREQQRQSEVQQTVVDMVSSSADDLKRIGLKGEDVAAAVSRMERTTAQAQLATNMLLLAIARGSVADREQALQFLDATVREQLLAGSGASGALPLLRLRLP